MTGNDNEKILAAYRIACEKGCQDIAQLLYEVIVSIMNGNAIISSPFVTYAEPILDQIKIEPDGTCGGWVTRCTGDDVLSKEMTV